MDEWMRGRMDGLSEESEAIKISNYLPEEARCNNSGNICIFVRFILTKYPTVVNKYYSSLCCPNLSNLGRNSVFYMN